MLLCDIGNTSYHFYDGINDYKHDVEGFDPSGIEEELFYISVNPRLAPVLEQLPNWKDLSAYIVW